MGAAVAAATALVVTEASTQETATSAGYWLVPLEEGGSDNIEKLAEKLTSFDPDHGCLFVYDLLGNTTFRFKQFN
jgi:mannose/fructose-specific phosphotransferase system component IIA